MSDDELPNVHYGSPSKHLDWRKESLHDDSDDDEWHTPSKSTRLLLRLDPRRLFPLNTKEHSIIENAEIGRLERAKVFNRR